MSNIKGKKDRTPKDENGLPHGEWFIYYSNGELAYCGNCIHGVDHGLFEGFSINGNLRYRGNLNMGRQIGYWYYFSKPESYYLCII